MFFEKQPQIPFGFAQGRLSTHHPQAEKRLGPRSLRMTTLVLRRTTLVFRRTTLVFRRTTLVLRRTTLVLRITTLVLRRTTLVLRMATLVLRRTTLVLLRTSGTGHQEKTTMQVKQTKDKLQDVCLPTLAASTKARRGWGTRSFIPVGGRSRWTTDTKRRFSADSKARVDFAWLNPRANARPVLLKPSGCNDSRQQKSPPAEADGPF